MILVRHAEPAKNRMLRPDRWGLSEEGHRQAGLLASELRSFEPDGVYASPEPKARQTADILAAEFGLSVRSIEQLREHDRSNVPYFSTQEEFEDNVHRFFESWATLVVGLESASDCLARFREGIDRVITFGDRQPIIVSHGTVLSVYLGERYGLDPSVLWAGMPVASYTVIGAENSSFPGLRSLGSDDTWMQALERRI